MASTVVYYEPCNTVEQIHCDGNSDCWYGSCQRSSGVCTCDDGWEKDETGICRVEPCDPTTEDQFQDESCYKRLTHDQSNSFAKLEQPEAISYCEGASYRLPHVGSPEELAFLDGLTITRFNSDTHTFKIWVDAYCTGEITDTGMSTCFWNGWDSRSGRHMANSVGELIPQTCNTNCYAVSFNGGSGGRTFQASRVDLYPKHTFCERPIYHECKTNSHCGSESCVGGRCRCIDDNDCDTDLICRNGGCVSLVPTTVRPTTTHQPTTTQKQTTTEEVTTRASTQAPTTTDKLTTKGTTQAPTTTEKLTTKATTRASTTTEKVTTTATTQAPTTTEKLTAQITTQPSTTEALPSCPDLPGSFSFNTSCYVVPIHRLNHSGAEDWCNTRYNRSSLVVVESPDEKEFLTRVVSPDKRYWIAPSNSFEGFEFRPVGKLHNGVDDPACFVSTFSDIASAVWFNGSCARLQRFICEVKNDTNEAAFMSCSNSSTGIPHGSSCYYIENSVMNNSNAQSFCQRWYNGSLLSIDTRMEENFLAAFVSNYKQYWIGLWFSNEYGYFGSSGEVPLYLNLNVSIVEDINLCYVGVFNPVAPNSWFSRKCSDQRPFVCEVDTKNHECLNVNISDGSCYYFEETNLNISNARHFCMFTYNGSLVAIETPSEMDFLRTVVSSRGEYWIGLDFTAGEGFSWNREIALAWMDMVPIHTINLTEYDCFVAVFGNSSAPKWSSKPCNESQNFICEISNDVGPTVSHCSTLAESIPFGKSCYLIVEAQWNITGAIAYCSNLNGELVSIETPEEQGFLNREVISGEYWIGLRFSPVWGYEWMSESEPVFLNLEPETEATGEIANNPAITVEEFTAEAPTTCYAAIFDTDGRWFSRNCSKARNFICEIRNDTYEDTAPQPTTEPTTTKWKTATAKLPAKVATLAATTAEKLTTKVTTAVPTTTEKLTTKGTTRAPTTTEKLTTKATTPVPTTTEKLTTKVTTQAPTTTEEVTTKIATQAPTATEELTTEATTRSPTTTEKLTTGITSSAPATTEELTTKMNSQAPTTTEELTTEVTTGAPTATKVTTSRAPMSCTLLAGVLLYRGSCYKVENFQKGFHGAQQHCWTAYRGHLVAIGSQGEQDFLASIVSAFNNYWIGLTYTRKSNEFDWSNGEDSHYMNIHDNTTVDADTVCYIMDRTREFAWTDTLCSQMEFFVCEMEDIDYVAATTTVITTADATTTVDITTETLTTEILTTEMATTVGPSGCDEDPCLNGAQCVDIDDGFVCRCQIGYGGELCEEDLTPDFDPELSQEIQVEDLVPEGHIFMNPYYVLGRYYIPMLLLPDDLPHNLAQYDNILHIPGLTAKEEVSGRSEVGSYPVLDLQLLQFDYETNPLYGLRCSDDCAEGFAVSFWLLNVEIKIEGTEPEYLFLISTANIVAYAVVMEGNDITIHVSMPSGYRIDKRLPRRDLPHGWFNLGLSWHPDIDFEVYINGRPVTVEEGGPIFTFMDTSPSVSIADLVIWDRYINSFEVHRFMGMEADQFRRMTTADLYWSLDAFIRRDHLMQFNSTHKVAMTTPIETADRTMRHIVPGRDSKGFGLEINGADQWLQLGTHEGSCLSNPEVCPEGLTVEAWLKFTAPSDNDFHCVLSTGAQSSRGVALYQFGDKLRGILADGGREWITEISMENVSSWTHVAMSWKRSEGLFFYLGGVLKAADYIGIRRIRQLDLDFGLTVGRRNDFLGDFAHVTLSEIAVWFKLVLPWESREMFGFPANPLFAAANVNWDAHRLLSSDYKLLGSLRRANLSQETAIGVSFDNVTETVALSRDDAFLTLALPTDHADLVCFADLDSCVDGFSVSVWLHIDTEVEAWWANGVFQIISGLEGVAVQLTQQGLFVSLSLGPIRRDYLVSVLNIPVEQWFSLVVTWSKYEDLAVYINGRPMAFMSINEQMVSNLGTDFFVIQSNQFKVGVGIHNLAVWNKYFYPKKIWQLIGLSESMLSFLHLGAQVWPFENPISLLFPYEVTSLGVHPADSRYLDGDAIKTDGTDEGMITLGDYSGWCPHKPSECLQGFSVSFWLKPVLITTRRVAHLVSLGADVHGGVGFTITQSRQKITGLVSNGTATWEASVPAMNISYGEWMYLAMLWIPDSGMLMVVNGQLISSQSEPFEDIRTSEAFGTLVLGGRTRNRRLEATFDEVMVLVPQEDEMLPSPDYYTGNGGSIEGYASADSYFDVTDWNAGSVQAVDTTLTEDRFHNEEGAADTAKNEVKDFGYVTVGDFPGHCLSDPAMCHPAGLTISLWIKMGNVDHFMDPATNSEGVGYILSSGAQADDSHGYAAHYNGTHITTSVVDGTVRWTTTFKYIFGKNWTNYALGWNERDGVNVFVDGEVKGSDVNGITLDVPIEADNFTELQLGKRNDAEDGYLGAAFDDVAIWIYTFSPEDPEVSKTLKGEETKEEEIEVTEDHEELLKAAPLTWKADCRVIHEADCARNINELLEIVEEEAEFTVNATKSIYGRLLNLTSSKELPDSTEVEAGIQVMDKLSKKGLPVDMGEVDAVDVYEKMAESVSNLLEEEMSPMWENITEPKYGVSALMQNLEKLGVAVATRLPVTETYSGCSRLFRKNKLVTCMDRFPTETFGQGSTVLPPMVDLGSNDTNSTDDMRSISDKITLPPNLFRFTILKTDCTARNGISYYPSLSTIHKMKIKLQTGNVGSFVFSYFDNIQDVLASNMSDQLPVHYTGDAFINSRIISLAIDPPLRRDLYNPVVIQLEYHQQFSNDTVETVCAFWNFTGNQKIRGWWDTAGCKLTSSNSTHINCSCTHLTHFAVVSSPIIPILPNPHHARIAVMAMSLFFVNAFLLFHLVFVFIRNRRLHTLRNSIHLQQCLAVLLLGASVVASTMGRNSENFCMLAAISFQYAALSVLIWIAVEALQLAEDSYRGLHLIDKKNFSQCDDRLKIYYATAWGLPVLVVATTIAGGEGAHQQIGSGICFLTHTSGAMWAFYVPFMVSSLISLLLLLVVARYYDIHIKRQDITGAFRSSLRATCVLVPYYFLAWIIGSKGLYGEVMGIQYIFVLLMICLGFVLYLLHGIGNVEVRALLFCEDPDVALTAVKEIHLMPEEIILPPKPTYKP